MEITTAAIALPEGVMSVSSVEERVIAMEVEHQAALEQLIQHKDREYYEQVSDATTIIIFGLVILFLPELLETTL